ncbi:outer membrane beta-barrel protein [Pseudokordiimonas caeni]|uniref:outer membrane beta-barrel protein n=1 Tax=Pseudokordiimonas caeni TaxID=2997908 RepID=UPI002810EDEF|nr:outer membrane beta-barrel protein [Pseudokordiimonas caeni]
MSAPRVDGLSLAAMVQETYYDNFLRLSDIEMDADPSIKTSEFVTRVMGDLQVGRNFGRQQISAAVRTGYQFHKENSNLDNDFLDARAALNWALGSRCSGAFAGDWGRQQSEFESLADIVKSTLTEKAVSAYAECGIGGRISLAVAGELGTASNSADRRKQNDHDDKGAYSALRFSYAPDSYIGVAARYFKYEYPERPLIDGVRPEFQTKELMAELQHSLGARMKLSLSGGAVQVDSNSTTEDPGTGISGSAGLTYNLGGRHVIDLQAYKSYQPLQNLEALYSSTKGVQAAIASNWSPAISTNIDVGYLSRSIAYADDFVPTVEGLNTGDDTFTANASVGYTIGRLIMLEVGGRYIKRDSNVSNFDYTDKSVFISLRLKWD